MRQTEMERMLIDHENRLRMLEGRELATRNYKAPQERDILLKKPIETPKPIKVEAPKEVTIIPNRDKEREAIDKKLEEEEEKETKMSGVPERKKEEGEKDVFPEPSANKEKIEQEVVKEKPSVEQSKDLKPKEDIKEDKKEVKQNE